MLPRLLQFILFTIFSCNAIAHSGGTNSAGCHAGTQPYHCHVSNDGTGGSSSTGTSSDFSIDGVDAWDLNLGYRYSFDGASPIPYFGLSVGKRYDSEDVVVGADLGLHFTQGFYVGFVSTSNSIQLGFRALHLSFNQDSIGLGIRFPFNKSHLPTSSVYFSGSGLFSGESDL